MTGHRIGYKRVSTLDQNTIRQLDGVQLDKVFEDHASGKDVNRPQLALMLEFLRDGDTLVVHSMDRLARSLVDLRKMVSDLTSKGVRVEFIKENLAFTGNDSPMATLLLSMLGAVAEFERAMIHERQREGIAIAKTQGRYKGRKQALTGERLEELLSRYRAGEKVAPLAREYGISRQTLYTYVGANILDNHILSGQ